MMDTVFSVAIMVEMKTSMTASMASLSAQNDENTRNIELMKSLIP